MGTEVSEQASCVEGKSFDTVTRTCVVSAFRPAPPEIEEFNITISEDTINGKIQIPYFDKNKDIAKICEVIDYGSLLSSNPPTCECVAGKCFAYISPNENIHGESFVSFILTDKDGKSKEAVSRVTIEPVNDSPEVSSIALGISTELTYSSNPSEFIFYARDIDNEPVTGCEVVAHSENLILGNHNTLGSAESSVSNNCVCFVESESASRCSVKINVPKNLDSLDEFISYRVFSLGDFSEIVTTRFTIKDEDDPPVLCLYSRGVDFPECGSEGCVGNGAPNESYMAPTSHSEKKPVIYLDQVNGECYHSVNESTFEKSDEGAPSLEFGYIYVEVEEDSSSNVFTLRPGVDIDSVVNTSTSEYNLVTETGSLGEYKNNIDFDDDCAVENSDLDCAISPPADKNDFHLHRVVILNNTDQNPSLVFRERIINDMSGKGITIQSGASGGAAIVSMVDKNIYITIEDGVTTAQTIKEAIENDSSISSLVKVNLFGSKKEDVFNDDGSSWPKTFELLNLDKTASSVSNTQGYFGYFTYSMEVENSLGVDTTSNSVPVFVSVSSKNDTPVARDLTLGEIGDEENLLEFSLPIAKDENDFHDESFGYIITGINSYEVNGEDLPVGEISHCANLENSDGPSDLTCQFKPSGNYNGDVNVKFRAIDQYGASSDEKTVTFSVADIDDPPVLCQYHRFNQAQECGHDGCISEFSPVGRITPSSHIEGAPVYFYQKGAAYCFRSTGTGINDWAIDETGHIGDVVVNQEQQIIIDNIAVDEGGPGAEDEQDMTITDVAVEIESGDSGLLEVVLVEFFDINDESNTFAISGDIEFEDGGSSADIYPFKIRITPQAGLSGVARVTFKMSDGLNTLTSSFRVTVQSVDVFHEGWKNIQAIGPKTGGSSYCEGINSSTGVSYIGTVLTRDECNTVGGIWRSGDILEEPYVCSYSETKCNGGEKCTGTSVSGVKADEFNAIFSQVTSSGERSCYRARGKLDLGYLTLKSKQAGSVFVVVENTTENSTTVEHLRNDQVCDPISDFIDYKFSGGDLFHYIKLNLRYGATSDEVYEAFENSDASEVIEVVNNSAAQVMSLNNGIYTLGIKDVYYKRVGGLLFASHQKDMSVEIIDKSDNGIDSSIINNNLLLRVGSDSIEKTCEASLKKLTTLNKIMIIDLDADNETDNDLGVLTTSKVNLQKSSANYFWDSLETFCNITQSDHEAICREEFNLGASCAGGALPEILSQNKYYNSFYADLDSRRCYRSDNVDSFARFNEYVATGETTLSWENFRATGGSISGYEIFRKLGTVYHGYNEVNGSRPLVNPSAGEWQNRIRIQEFDDYRPIAKLEGGNHSTFVDNFSTTRLPPVPGTVYFYEVRPIVEGVQASAMEPHSVVRIFSPPRNFVFVHRWIANQTMCNLMNSQSRSDFSDRMGKYEEYKKCRYTGPEKATNDYYDLGHDLLVMQVEAGCPYTRRGCSLDSTSDGYDDQDCIGVGDPSGRITGATGSLFYDRETQQCYVNNSGVPSGTSWTDVTGSAEIHEHFFNQKLAPLTNITQGQAKTNFCEEVSKNLHTNTLGVVTVRDNGDFDTSISDGLTPGHSTVKEHFFSEMGELQVSNLPTRLEQIAYSQWDTNTLTDEEIEILEQGLSLNATSRCNSSYASGLDDEFINGDSFSVSAPYTKTSTKNALDSAEDLVRSLETGSSITSNCKSRYGVQDHVGNMSEMSLNTVTFDGSVYKLGDYTSPCETDVDTGLCLVSSDFTWSLDQQAYDANYFNLPLGLPFSIEADVDENNFNYVEIGTTAGITTAQLHDDIVSFSDEFYSPTLANGKVFLSGGSYKTGRGAGTWTMQLFKNTDHTDYKDVGFRCVIPLKENNYFESQFGAGNLNHP